MTHADEAHSVLSMLCPLADPETGILMGFDGRLWPTDEPTARTALALLPPRTLRTLADDFPEATPPARRQICEAVGMLASTVADSIENHGSAQREGTMALGAACGIMSANVANTLAYREVLDGICGDGDEDLRDTALPVALKVFETGEVPQPPRDAREDTEAFALASLPQIDYLAADTEVRKRAGAFLMTFVLAYESNVPYLGWTCMHEPADPVSSFAREHLNDPGRWADAVREHRTFDPDALRPELGPVE
ncbi:hypothetical protein [Sinomonas susongensis]|uniref:hypothetical protein n=1 Tax=Sinomonas susongensis TaxID=1324851 RepID=UPI0011090BD6|nr:hypothetical protein [Sinomonas susongensis]